MNEIIEMLEEQIRRGMNAGNFSQVAQLSVALRDVCWAAECKSKAADRTTLEYFKLSE